MNLAALLDRLDTLDDGLAIYAEPPWTPDTRAAAIVEPGDGSIPVETRGLTYLTTVGQARRAIATRRQWRPDLMLTPAHACDAVIYYARYDECEPLPSVNSGEIRLPTAI